MPLRKARPIVHRPLTVTDAVDGTNAAPNLRGGSSSMLALSNVVPAMHTLGVVVPRPASYKLFDFSAFGEIAASGELLQEIGNRLYGFVTSPRFSGYSEPFCYDFALGVFVPIQGTQLANLPLSAPATGDWEPPTMVRVGAFILFSHPGFAGSANAFGWLDQTSFSDSGSGNTAAGTPAVTGLSKNVMTAGWRPGMLISDSGGLIPIGTQIASVAIDGLSLTMTASASAALTGDTLTVTGGSPSSPLWSAGNTSINPVPGHVTALSLFNSRAEYAVDNSVNWSDAGDPLVRTNANQAVTIQNGVKITALSTQPFSNATVIGGVVQGLLILQGDSGIWQLTGDSATANLALNFMSPLGTLAPLTLAPLPDGTYFVAPDGVRKIQLDGTVSEPFGTRGQGVALPFINALYPSRMCAAYNEDVYRVSVTGYESDAGVLDGDIVAVEYWYHLRLEAWSGPHSFPAKLICASNRSATNHGFVMFPLLPAPGAASPLPEVWFSNTRPLVDATYIENGEQLNWVYQTTLLPDTQTDFMNMVVESTIFVGLAPAAIATVVATNEIGNLLDEVTISGFTEKSPTPIGQWGTMVWGSSLWGGEQPTSMRPSARRITWHKPIVFRQMTVAVSGPSNPDTAIGNLYLRYQQLGYQLADPGVAA